MLEVKNIEVYGLHESIVASGYAMRTQPYDYNDYNPTTPTEQGIFQEKHLTRAVKLAKCPQGSGHTNFRTGITVQFDVKYPQYWSMEFQRYHFIQIITSMSKMHKLLMMDIDETCNKYVSQSQIDTLKADIERYNMISKTNQSNYDFKLRNGEVISTETKEEALYYAWMICISDCPMGIELWMRVSTNYEQLATIYKQRKHHRLKEDWGNFCKFIESLPYANELIIC